MLSCVDVANYFLVLANHGGTNSGAKNNRKKLTLPQLTRLVCIAQGVSLALRDKPLFNEDIEACAYEMIVKDLRGKFQETSEAGDL